MVGVGGSRIAIVPTADRGAGVLVDGERRTHRVWRLANELAEGP